jgi:hypothetical protein
VIVGIGSHAGAGSQLVGVEMHLWVGEVGGTRNLGLRSKSITRIQWAPWISAQLELLIRSGNFDFLYHHISRLGREAGLI